MSLVKEIKSDPVFKKFMAILENTMKALDVEADHKEMLARHASRTSRSLKGGDRYSPHKLIDANMQDLSIRARLVEIRVKNSKKLEYLKEAMEALRRHVVTEYVDDLADYRTEGQRKALVDRVMKKANEFVASAESLLSALDHIIKDIDQSSHSMRHSVELLKLLSDTKGRAI